MDGTPSQRVESRVGSSRVWPDCRVLFLRPYRDRLGRVVVETTVGGTAPLAWLDVTLPSSVRLCRFDIPMLLVGGNSKTAKVWGFTVEKQWHVIAELAGHSDVIHDVAWAPNLGRSCHWLATASKDRTIRIWKLKINPNRQEQSEVVQVTTKDHGAFEVWRVQWNVTGTMLASTGDDGTVRMWQQDYKHQWQCVHAVSGDLA
ncbi:hypothetical protein DYB36_011368 [Aphanomyces astaci]|uniref:Uncharacterized protein n=1 Tax=Aphanomyces astaci TaxID=112090 RepID=A0A397BNS3_APHAT|nr:hypothetical protein DYB36_011368 [Aphanomyces astaci]